MNITGTTFNFTKRVTDEVEPSTPEKPVDGDRENKPKSAGDKGKNGKDNEKNAASAFAYDMIKTGVQQTMSAIISNVSGSPTLQVQLQAAQQVGGKIIAYTAAAATGNWAAVATMAISDMISYGVKQAEYNRNKAWSDYELNQYRDRHGYTASRGRR